MQDTRGGVWLAIEYLDGTVVRDTFSMLERDAEVANAIAGAQRLAEDPRKDVASVRVFRGAQQVAEFGGVGYIPVRGTAQEWAEALPHLREAR